MSARQIYRSFLALLGILGVSLQIAQDGWGMLLYYTVLSNMLVFSFLLYLVKAESQEQNLDQAGLVRLKGGVTMAITITFVIYHFLLAPIAKPEDFWNIRNFLVHYIVPIGLILDTLILDKKNSYRLLDPLAWTSTPLIYCVLALFNGLVTKLPVPGAIDSPFPYFFINLNKYGWLGVLQNSLGIFIGYVIFGYGLLLLKKVIGKK